MKNAAVVLALLSLAIVTPTSFAADPCDPGGCLVLAFGDGSVLGKCLTLDPWSIPPEYAIHDC